jgi:hypothetical protein
MPPNLRERLEALKQRQLRSEIEDISSTIKMDVWNIEKYKPESRTRILEDVKSQLVRGEVITRYTFIDEILSHIIANPKGNQKDDYAGQCGSKCACSQSVSGVQEGIQGAA